MECKNPELCKKKYNRWKQNQSYMVPIGEKEHEKFLSFIEDGNAELEISTHADRRQFLRSISLKDIKDVVLNGWVIERNFFPDVQAVRLVILGYTRNYRPLHVVCEIINETHWEIVTTYSPESQAYKWSKDYQERICFCKHDGK